MHNQEVNLEFIIKNCSRRRELLGNPKILFGNALGKHSSNLNTNHFAGAQAIALLSAFTAKLEEDRQRRSAEKAALNAKLRETHALNIRLAIIAREKRESARRAAARRAREKARRKKAATNPLQALWDANGAAIYGANKVSSQKN